MSESPVRREILLRVRLLYLLFVLVGSVVIVRLLWVQFVSSEVAYNADRLQGRIFSEQVVRAHRGSILTRDGEVLATSLFYYQVDFDFAAQGLDEPAEFTEQADSLSKLMAAYFQDRTEKEYKTFFRKEYEKHRSPRRDHRPVELFPRRVDYTEWQQMRQWPMLNWNLGMVYNLRQEDARVYPQAELGRRTIGLTGDRGNYGVEDVWRAVLKGRDGMTTRQRIARGFSGRVADARNLDPVPGLDVVTTLDLDVQEAADKYLRAQMERENAIWGTTIVLEVQTGAIAALVNLGRTPQGRYAERENYALGRSTEPGSTFKLASMLLLLEDAGAPLSLSYDTGNGAPVEVGGIRVQDSHAGFSVMDFRTAVAQSSNVWFAKAIWERYAAHKDRYDRFMRGLHLDRTVGLEAFGEVKPFFEDFNKVPDPNGMLVRRAFGYRIKLTPIQVATFYNAIAAGRMLAPRLVNELRRGNEVVRQFPPRVLVEKIASEQTLQKVRSLLESVGVEGTGARFFGDTTLYRVAAKTGTAQYADQKIGYRDGYYVGTMAAYFPAHAPRYTVLTTIHTHRQPGKAFYGGPLAGPVVRDVIRYLYNRHHDWSRHAPAPSVSTPPAPKPSVGAASPGIPNVVGMGLKDALFALEERGLKVVSEGSGTVVSQSAPSGADGTEVTIILR